MLERTQAIDLMNLLGQKRTPFLFYTDFLGECAWIEPLDAINPDLIRFNFNGATNWDSSNPTEPVQIQTQPITFDRYNEAIQTVLEEIRFGNSYLLNLTFSTPIQLNTQLDLLFQVATARYKLWIRDQFVCYSPETFVQLSDGFIRSYPMKGTISQGPGAADQILHDKKEFAEHVTIVDLIRNDMSRIADQVEVKRWRYIDEIQTNKGPLLQVSSEIQGRLDSNWQGHLGDYLFHLLPAGSISGAPKRKTLEIIQQVETHSRGFYTGVCGCFDGKSLDSGVMIRFIQQTEEGLFYKSGGGITSFSDPKREYEEYQEKIYVPVL